MRDIRALIVRFARENDGWGYSRIQGALRNVGHRVSPTTTRNVLKQNGIKPAPDRPTSWCAFLNAHGSEIASTDFFTVEAWTPRGLRTYDVLFLLELDTRRARLVGVTTSPTDVFMAGAAERIRGLLPQHRFLICDGDARFRYRFKLVLEATGMEIIKTPFQAPNANAHAERFVRSVRQECLHRLIVFGEGHLGPGLARSSATSASADC